mgnify:FL=1
MADHCTHPLCEAHAAFLASRGTEKLSEHTLRRYRNDVHGVALHMPAQATIDNLDEHLKDALNDYAGKHSHTTVAGAMSTWATWVAALLDEEPPALDRNPLRGLKRPKVAPPTPKSLTNPKATVARLLASVERGERGGRDPWPERDLALFAVYIGTGVRLHELTAANLADLGETEAGAILKVTGKGRKERWAPVPPEVSDVIAAFQASRASRIPKTKTTGTAPLICDHKGERLRDHQVQYIVEKCYAAAGVSAQKPSGALVHALRHTCATLMAAAKVPATSIQGALGHASLATSQRYVTVTDDAIHEAARKSPAMASLRALRAREESA